MKKFFSLIFALVTVVIMSLISNRAEAQTPFFTVSDTLVCHNGAVGVINYSQFDSTCQYYWYVEYLESNIGFFYSDEYQPSTYFWVDYQFLPIGNSQAKIHLEVINQYFVVSSYVKQITITRGEFPEIVTSTGINSFCFGEEIVISFDDSNDPIYNFYWENPSEIDSSITMTNGGEVSLVFYNSSNGCKNSIQEYIEMNYPPTPPSVTTSPEGCHLASNMNFEYTGLQWYKENTALDSYGQFYNPIEPGFYMVEASNYNGCKAKSNPIWSSCSVAGLEDSELSKTEVYPNPFDSELNISLPEDGQLHSVQLINILGEKVAEVSGYGNLNIQRNKLLPGIYFVRTDSGRSIKVTAQ